MIVLGIDTAIRCTGYGVLNFDDADGRTRVLDCGVIRNTASMPHSECLRRLAGGIRELASSFKPDSAAIEGAFVNKNIKTAMILSYARGAVMTVLAENSIPIYAYSPRKAKVAISGNGNASKEQIALILSSMLGLKLDEIPLDSTDAIALAICHGRIAVSPSCAELLPKAL